MSCRYEKALQVACTASHSAAHASIDVIRPIASTSKVVLPRIPEIGPVNLPKQSGFVAVVGFELQLLESESYWHSAAARHTFGVLAAHASGFEVPVVVAGAGVALTLQTEASLSKAHSAALRHSFGLNAPHGSVLQTEASLSKAHSAALRHSFGLNAPHGLGAAVVTPAAAAAALHALVLLSNLHASLLLHAFARSFPHTSATCPSA
jgi:hypothetical protein